MGENELIDIYYLGQEEEISLRALRILAKERCLAPGDMLGIAVPMGRALEAANLPGFVPVWAFNPNTHQAFPSPDVIGAVERFVMYAFRDGMTVSVDYGVRVRSESALQAQGPELRKH